MTSLSLREAAREAGVSKSTILRAIQSGRLAAPRNDEGGYAIDPAELFKAYQPRAAVDAAAEPATIAPKEALAGLSIRQAARLAGVSKSTILRAIRSGRLSPPKGDDGNYAIDPAALCELFKPEGKGAAAEESVEPLVQEEASFQEEPPAAPDSSASDLAARMAALEAELLDLKKLLAEATRPRESWWKRLVG
jgi:excisionase family DNA binding protein